jgi:hypothetical protein
MYVIFVYYPPNTSGFVNVLQFTQLEGGGFVLSCLAFNTVEPTFVTDDYVGYT